MKKISAAVIGLGNMGKHHARIYGTQDSVNLKAVCDVDKERAEYFGRKYNSKYVSDYVEILEDDEIDVISIAAPTYLHSKIALDCISAGKHTLIEKPIATSLEECEKIEKTAGKHPDIKVMIGHIERFNPAVQYLKKLVERGALTDIQNFSAQRLGPYPPTYKNSNVLLDLASHDIDVIRYLFGDEVSKVYCIGGYKGGNSVVDYANILLEMENKVSGCIECNWLTPKKIRRLSLVGGFGLAELGYITRKVTITKANWEKEIDNLYESSVEEKSSTYRPKGYEPLEAEINHFLACINNDYAPLTSIPEGIQTLRVVLAAFDSLKKGKIINLL